MTDAGDIPLHMAASLGHYNVVRLLMEKGADVTAKTLAGLTPLHVAAKHGRTAVVQQLLEKGAAPSASGSDPYVTANIERVTPLHLAAGEGHGLVVRALLRAGADTDAKSSDGETPVLWWCFGASSGVRLCWELEEPKGPKGTDAKSSDGETPEDVARRRTPEDVAQRKNHVRIVRELKVEARRRAECLAFAMGQHDRMGAGSLVWGLDAGVVRMVLDRL